MADLDGAAMFGKKIGHRGLRVAGIRMDYALSRVGYSYPEAVQRIKWGRRVTRHDVAPATLKKLVKNGWLKLSHDINDHTYGRIRHSGYAPGSGPAKKKPRRKLRPVRVGRKPGGFNG